MANARNHYEVWLKTIEAEQLDLMGEILEIELFLYDVEKVFRQAKQLDAMEEPELRALSTSYDHLRNRLKYNLLVLEDKDLDIEHCKFMIRWHKDRGL